MLGGSMGVAARRKVVVVRMLDRVSSKFGQHIRPVQDSIIQDETNGRVLFGSYKAIANASLLLKNNNFWFA